MAIMAHLDPRAASDGRTASRRALRLETSGVVANGDAANVTVHNISAAGLLLETALDLTVGEHLAVDLPEAGIVSAVIVWRSDRLYGCAFEQALGQAALAAAQLQGAAVPTEAHSSIRAARRISSSEPLGVRLNRLRREAGMTLADVATTLNVSKPTVWAWEKGKARPLPERLDAIAAALGVPAEVLTGKTGASDEIGALIEDCRTRIAKACGTAPESVRIMVEL